MNGLRHWKRLLEVKWKCVNIMWFGEMVTRKDWKVFLYTLGWIFMPYNHSGIRVKLWDIPLDKEMWNSFPGKVFMFYGTLENVYFIFHGHHIKDVYSMETGLYGCIDLLYAL